MNQIITMFAIMGAAVQLVFLYIILYTVCFTEKGSTKSMEINYIGVTASQKHIHGNWQGKIPEVHR